MSKKFVKYLVPVVLAAAALVVGFSLFKKNARPAESADQLLNLVVENSAESSTADNPQNLTVADDFSVVPDNLPEVGSGDWEILCPGYAQNIVLPEDGSFYSKDNVALYIHTYGKLPKNFIKKSEWEKLGTDSSPYKQTDALVIGGDRFYNREGLLPKKSGRTYTECDIDTLNKKSRGAKRIVFSNDGLIYYTADHYETFELLYGEE